MFSAGEIIEIILLNSIIDINLHDTYYVTVYIIEDIFFYKKKKILIKINIRISIFLILFFEYCVMFV